MPTEKTQIISDDFDGLVSEIATEIWNKIIHDPSFPVLQPARFADLFEAVYHALVRYHRKRTQAVETAQ